MSDWNPPVNIGTTLGDLERIVAKEMNHKHSGHEAIMSGGANACPICQAFKIRDLERRNAELEKELADAKAAYRTLAEIAEIDTSLRERNAKLVELANGAIAFGQHHHTCGIFDLSSVSVRRGCTCGYDRLKDEIAKT